MFGWLSSVFKSKGHTSSSDPISLSKQREKSSFVDGEATWVYIWKMTSQDVGHAAIQVGGSEPKMDSSASGQYISIHPGGLASTGITTVLPLPPRFATTLKEDMEVQAASRNKVNLDDFSFLPTLVADKTYTALPPDQIFKIGNLDTDAMHARINKIRDAKLGKMGYQLFPRIDLLGFFSDSPHFIAQDPIDAELYRRFPPRQDSHIEVNNCTTLVSDILTVGGKRIEQTKKPWGITPDGLAEQITKSPGM